MFSPIVISLIENEDRNVEAKGNYSWKCETNVVGTKSKTCVVLHRAIFRGEDDEGPVFIFSVNNPKLLNDVELRGFSVHHSAKHHPRLEECEIIARQRIRG